MHSWHKDYKEAQHEVLSRWFSEHTRDDPIYKQDWDTFVEGVEDWAKKHYPPGDVTMAASMVWLWRPLIDHQHRMYEQSLTLFDRTIRFLHNLRTER